MDLPLIETPVAPRWMWIEEITYSHIPIATLITAFMVLAPIIEYVGYRRRDPRCDRLAKSYIWFAMILFSPGAALGTGIPMWIIGTYPEFWSRWANLFFWVLIAQFIFFLFEVFFLFFFYYLTWNVWMTRKRLHIVMGAIAAFWGLLVQTVWDAVGSYMLTPGGVALPKVGEPVAWSAAAFFNPSYPFLFSHRFFGNISYVMLLVGGVFALKYMAQKDPEEKAYFGWATNVMVTVGLLAFFAMPLIGWFYARCIQAHAPVSFHALMGGHSSVTFMVKMALIVVFVVITARYLFLRYRSKTLLYGTTAGLASLFLWLWLHPPLPWLGGPLVWRIVTTGVLAGFIAWLWTGRGGGDLARRRWQWALFAAGLAAFFAFCLGGFVRSSIRNPYTVYKEIQKPEVETWEADRFLFYDKCMHCHHAKETPNDIRYAGVPDWKEYFAKTKKLELIEKKSDVRITPAEVDRIIRYLEGHSR